MRRAKMKFHDGSTVARADVFRQAGGAVMVALQLADGRGVYMPLADYSRLPVREVGLVESPPEGQVHLLPLQLVEAQLLCGWLRDAADVEGTYAGADPGPTRREEIARAVLSRLEAML